MQVHAGQGARQPGFVGCAASRIKSSCEFSSESGTLNGSVGLTEKGAGLLSTIKQDPSAIGSIARRVSGSFDPVSATGGIADAQGAQISTLGSPSLLAGPGFQNAAFNFRISNGHIEFGDGYAGRAAYLALDYVFGGPVDTSGSGRIESFDFLPGRSQVNAGVAGLSAVAALAEKTAIRLASKVGAKSADEMTKHLSKLGEARDRVQALQRELERVKGPKAQAPVRAQIDKLAREIKGHEKEIRQKWPELGDEF